LIYLKKGNDVAKVILIVDDSASLRQVVRMALEKEGFAVLEAGNGNAALLLLDGREIDMVVSDVNMPGMGGVEFVRKLKSIVFYKFTPVLMLTTETTDEKKQAGKAAGASGWMVKPFVPSSLVNAAKKLIK
jgi:two-component system chemotaxis response regulator CheY